MKENFQPMKKASSAIRAADVFLRKTAFLKRFYVLFGHKTRKGHSLKMGNSVDLSFLEVYGENLKTVRGYILEERSGNTENKRKLNKIIKTMKDKNETDINQNIAANNNSDTALEYIELFRRQKHKSILFFIVYLVMNFLTVFFKDSLNIGQYTGYILSGLLAVFSAVSCFSSSKRQQYYDEIIKQYVLEFFIQRKKEKY